MEDYVSSSKAQKFYKVSEQTLRDWANKGSINYITTGGGHRRYRIIEHNDNRKKIIYARVSSKKQEKDLENQVRYLKKRYKHYELVKDIGSGINYKRKGFKSILEQLFKGNIEEVVVSTGDRFSRFGRELFEWIFEQHGAKLTILDRGKFKSSQEELSDDLMEIITVFSARYYGRRTYKNKKDKVLPNKRTKKTI
jgi:predicted site-specific integrase-resolvase